MLPPVKLVTMKRVSVPVGAGLDAGDDALDQAPARGAAEKLLEAAAFAILGSGIEPRLRGSLQGLDMAAQRRRRDAEDEFDAACPAPVDDLGSGIMAVGKQQDDRLQPVGADRAQEAAAKLTESRL